MHPIFVDIHEPDDIFNVLTRATQPVRFNCEPSGFADYWWNAFGQEIMYERKQGPELIGAIGSKLDIQLGKYTKAHPESHIGIIQEGIITPTINGGCQTWRWRYMYAGKQAKHKRVKVLTPLKSFKLPFARYRSYMVERLLEGFSWIITTGADDTAQTLATVVTNTTRTAHHGLSVYTGEKKSGDPYVRLLRSITGIGEKTAEDLIERRGTPWQIFKMSEEALAYLETETIAKNVMTGIGKDKNG